MKKILFIGFFCAAAVGAQTLQRTFRAQDARVQYVRLTPGTGGEVTAEVCLALRSDDDEVSDTRCQAFDLTGARLVQARNLAQALRDNVLRGTGFTSIDAGAL